MEGAFPDKDARFAEWYVWAKREIGNDSRVCLGAAQAAMEALEGGADDLAARTAARRSVAGQGIALLSRIPPRQRAYAEWYDWARRELGGDRDRLHAAARAALDRLDRGGDAGQAAVAAQESAGPAPASPPPDQATSYAPAAADPHTAAAPVAPPGPVPPPPGVGPTAAPPAYQQPYPAYPAYAAVPPPPPPAYAYAGFWRRVGAGLIDAVLLTIGLVVLSFFVSFFAVIGLVSSGQDITGTNLGGVQVALYVIAFVLLWLYYAGLESSAWQGTIGKRLTRLLVTDRFGRRISFGRATGRYFGKALTGLIFLIGYLVIAVILEGVFGGDQIAGPLSWLIVADMIVAALGWLAFSSLVIVLTKRKQGLHDLIARTLVVRQEHLVLLTAPPSVAAAPPPHPGAGEVQQGA